MKEVLSKRQGRLCGWVKHSHKACYKQPAVTHTPKQWINTTPEYSTCSNWQDKHSVDCLMSFYALYTPVVFPEYHINLDSLHSTQEAPPVVLLPPSSSSPLPLPPPSMPKLSSAPRPNPLLFPIFKFDLSSLGLVPTSLELFHWKWSKMNEWMRISHSITYIYTYITPSDPITLMMWLGLSYWIPLYTPPA